MFDAFVSQFCVMLFLQKIYFKKSKTNFIAFLEPLNINIFKKIADPAGRNFFKYIYIWVPNDLIDKEKIYLKLYCYKKIIKWSKHMKF